MVFNALFLIQPLLSMVFYGFSHSIGMNGFSMFCTVGPLPMNVWFCGSPITIGINGFKWFWEKLSWSWICEWATCAALQRHCCILAKKHWCDLTWPKILVFIFDASPNWIRRFEEKNLRTKCVVFFLVFYLVSLSSVTLAQVSWVTRHPMACHTFQKQKWVTQLWC